MNQVGSYRSCGLGVAGSNPHKQGVHMGVLEAPNEQRGGCVCTLELGRVLCIGGVGQQDVGSVEETTLNMLLDVREQLAYL